MRAVSLRDRQRDLDWTAVGPGQGNWLVRLQASVPVGWDTRDPIPRVSGDTCAVTVRLAL
jgi:hypothetical protein